MPHKKARISMSKKDAVHEHVHLVKVLRSGSPAQRKAEANDQAKELKEYRKK